VVQRRNQRLVVRQSRVGQCRQLHYTELTKTLTTWGDAEDFYYDWPTADGTLVEEGWQIRLKYTARMAADLSDAEIFSRVKIYVNATENGSTEGGELQNNDDLGMTHTWNWGSGGEGENILTFKMPNVYNGMDGWLYGIRVVFTIQTDTAPSPRPLIAS
jgi:hypothetical protein